MIVLDGLLLVIRWVHAVSAVTWVGGGIFYVLVLGPASARSPLAAEARRAIGAEFRGLVHTVMAVLLITGIILSASRLTGNGASLYYVVALAIKIALAFYMFYVVRFRRHTACGRASGLDGFRLGQKLHGQRRPQQPSGFVQFATLG